MIRKHECAQIGVELMLLQEFGGANAVAYFLTTKIERWVLHLFAASDYNEGFCCYCVSFS